MNRGVRFIKNFFRTNERKEQEMSIGQESVGKIFTTTGIDVWRVVAYQDQPVVTMKNIETKEEQIFIAGSPAVKEFKALITITDV